MPGTGTTTLTLPPFRGAVRRIVIANLAVYFTLAVLSFATPRLIPTLYLVLSLVPERMAHGWIWQPLTYSFVNSGILGTAFGLLTLWFVGSMLEDTRGSRWFTGLFYAVAFGGGLLGALLALLPLVTDGRLSLFGLTAQSFTAGIFSPLFGVLVAFGIVFADVEMLFLFVLRLKVKYMVAIYVLLDLAHLISDRNALGAATELCAGLCGFLYVRYAAARGVSVGFSERYFAMRNDFYRWKRRRAAKSFQVYMKKQNRDVHFDNEGRYVSPEDERRDPSDKRWMN